MTLNMRLLVTGAVLGLLVALCGVFWLDLPTLLGMPSTIRYLPLFIAPIIYAILWRYGVKPLNNLLDLKEEYRPFGKKSI